MIKPRSVVSIDDLNDGDLSRLFFNARSLKDRLRTVSRARNAIMMTAFFEASTRTRLSFEMAALRLGLRVTTFATTTSSMVKGENVADSLDNLVAMEPDILVVRSEEPWDHRKLSSEKTAFINGGDGINEHPSQALLDCFTLLEHYKSDDLSGRRVLIIGDLAHSRVARSNIKLMTRLGAKLTLLAPPVFELAEESSARTIFSFSDVDGPYDAVMCLRMQKERMITGCAMTDGDYFSQYALTSKRLEHLGKDCVVMHPGPMNCGIEIDYAVANGPQSLILQQVRNGVVVRAALLEHCLA